MKIVGICGSPRKGHTEWMLSKVLEGAAKAGAETELILLREKNITACDGCLNCETSGTCSIQDDMQAIYPKLIMADGLALGTPTYFELLSGLLKNFMDRTCPIWRELDQKSVVGVAVAEAGIGKALENLMTYASLCSMHWVGHITNIPKSRRDFVDGQISKPLENLGEELVAAIKSSAKR